MKVFEEKKSVSSVSIAKNRLKTLLASDRIKCQPDTYDILCNELYSTLRKYLKISEKDFDVKITRTKIYITLSGEE